MSLHAFIILATLSIAAAVLWSDPRRLANQAFGLIALITSAWIFILWMLRTLEIENPVSLIRVASAIVALIPWAVWWSGRCIL